MADFFLRQALSIALPALTLAATLSSVASIVQAEDMPERVNDTGYGMALYEYHQGNSFQALTRLNVANAEGGVDGHGDHPALVEGGLMLAYGMTREAEKLFSELLEDSTVSDETRNQAWFYLGKVFSLENDGAAASDALERVDGDLLEDTDEALYHEWLYLKGQLMLASSGELNSDGLADILDELPEQSPWVWYLKYNRAVHRLAEGNAESAIDELTELVASTEFAVVSDEAVAAELNALEQQARLSLGRLYLGQGDFGAAMGALSNIPLDGVFSDQALYDYAVAASRNDQHGLALQALDTLQSRPLFTPWLQQVPFARAFTVEQMGRKQAALNAYRQAADHYESLDQRLAREQVSLTEAKLIEALSFLREEESQQPGAASQPSLGEETMLTDPYGRVRVRPDDFALAELLAAEPFQLALRELHELYRLDRSLAQWREQLDSFGVMLETRRTRREERIRETRASLKAQNVDQWVSRQADFRQRIEQASAAEDTEFFMTAEQRELKEQLDRVAETLARLPDNESTRKQRQTYQRMRAYFNWQIADEYSVNRWAAVRQLRELDEVMTTFVDQREKMEQEMASNTRLGAYESRIATQRAELNRLDARLDQALEQTRQSLMSQVSRELESQRGEIAGYLRASRHAQARLADELFLEANTIAPDSSSESSPKPDSSSEEGANE